MAYDRQPLAFLVDLCCYYTAFEVEKVRTVNYIFGLIAPRSNAWGQCCFRVTGLCEGNSPLTGEFPAQRVSNAENVSIWWHHHVYHSLDVITYIPSQWLAFQTNPNELKQVTTTAVWFSARGSDIRKFHPWFDLQPKSHYRNHNFLNKFREILSHHMWYFPRSNTSLTITVHYSSESLVNEWPLLNIYAICYSLSSRTNIFSKITYSRYR